MYIVLKILLTALIVVAISEISRRSTIIAGIVASIPLTSLLAIIWIYFDTNDLENIKNLSGNILLMIPPSLTFFISLPLLIDIKIEFYVSVFFSVLITAFVYWLYFYILGIFGINLS
tara:strand:+ start:1033 stop:1383 length:351 start_codon:yes stop_codon:yes gene_type:complete